jgi:predicted ATPase
VNKKEKIMRITEISLTNFRSFQATQNITLAPVTLMFGPNSVGKSSVLLALFYLQQILAKGHCDPQRIDVLGDKHIGGFASLVNAGDLNKRIVIKLKVDKLNTIGASYNQLYDLIGEDLGLTVDSPTADAARFAVEFHIGWSKVTETAYVACCKVWLDETLAAELSSDAGLMQPKLAWINYQHAALLTDQDQLDASEREDEHFVSVFHELLNAHRPTNPCGRRESWNLPEMVFDHAELGVKGFAGALPILGRRLESTFEHDDPRITMRMHEILSDLLVAPLDNVRALLDQSLCIGPLRMVPDALHRFNPYPEQKDWYNGAAAWDVVSALSREHKAPQLLAQINYWMNQLGLGYSLRAKSVVSKVVYSGGEDSLGELHAMLVTHENKLEISFSDVDDDGNSSEQSTSVDLSDFSALLQEIAPNSTAPVGAVMEDVRNHWALWDDARHCEVAFTEVGVGISQLFPLIVAAVVARQGVVTCEQPELHVHPRIQVGIGDLLTQANSSSSFLIETHSEHLILRILRRIRETTEGDLPGNMQPLAPEDVSIVYLDNSAGGVKATRIEIDRYGEFSSRWPRGFFSERREELF